MDELAPQVSALEVRWYPFNLCVLTERCERFGVHRPAGVGGQRACQLHVRDHALPWVTQRSIVQTIQMRGEFRGACQLREYVMHPPGVLSSTEIAPQLESTVLYIQHVLFKCNPHTLPALGIES